MVTSTQQYAELNKIKAVKILPNCFGKELCITCFKELFTQTSTETKRCICKKCFAFNDCCLFIKDFGYIKNGYEKRKNKKNISMRL